MASFLVVALLSTLLFMESAFASHDYGEALSKSLFFYEAQRSRKLPNTQRATWRANSGVGDNLANGVCSYKFVDSRFSELIANGCNVGMLIWSEATTMQVTMLNLVFQWHSLLPCSHGVIAYGKQLARSGELGYSMEGFQWGTEYLLKAHPEPNVLYGQVGDGISGHYCWQRPKDMTTPRQAYKIDTNNLGSDLAGETTAAFIVFKDSNPAYSNDLLSNAKQKNGYNVQRTPGGLLYWQKWNNMHFVNSASILVTVYSDYLSSAGKTLQCPDGQMDPSELLALVKSQVDYLLGNNPRATSYMVGYGSNYLSQVHHRTSSIVSYKDNPSFVSCKGGYATWFNHQGRDPNVLVGAIVGGPDRNDNFADERDNYEQTELATYNNAPMVGILAKLQLGNGGNNQINQ
ncbi:hypothetical protein KI387_018592, partial [Taxus chinensis]